MPVGGVGSCRRTVCRATRPTVHQGDSFRFPSRLSAHKMTSMIGRTLGHYRIDGKLGAGGMGIVYKAHDTRLERSVAIKMLPADAAGHQERRRRFVQEAKAASALNHPNIVHVYDIDTADDVAFMAMEYVDGQTLGDLLGRRRLPVGDTL